MKLKKWILKQFGLQVIKKGGRQFTKAEREKAYEVKKELKEKKMQTLKKKEELEQRKLNLKELELELQESKIKGEIEELGYDIDKDYSRDDDDEEVTDPIDEIIGGIMENAIANKTMGTGDINEVQQTGKGDSSTPKRDKGTEMFE